MLFRNQGGINHIMQNITTIEEILRLVELDDESTRLVLSNNQSNIPQNDNTNRPIINNQTNEPAVEEKVNEMFNYVG